MEKSKIGWLNGGNTFNPWIGCSPVSEACRNCYAKRETARFKMTPCFNTYRKVTSVSYWRRPLAWNRASDPEANKRGAGGSPPDGGKLWGAEPP